MAQKLTLQDFAGVWQLTREVKNAMGADAQVTGVARFEPVEAGLRLVEEGVMRLADGQRLEARQSYLWRASVEGEGIETFFDDGRAFFRFQPAGTVVAGHWCDPDQYDVALDFSDWPQWRSTWTVSGPRKSYVMRTFYTR